jgi:antitoxin component of MazEF toxin-antitoxin module
MNKAFLVILAGLLLIGQAFSVVPLQAQEQETETVSIGEVSDPGILPDSPFYFMKGWGRTIRLFLAFNAQEKAELALRFANEDALAVKKLCDKGEFELAEKHCEKFQEQFRRAIWWMERAREQSKDIEELIGRLRENHLRQQQVLAGVLDKVPEQAKGGVLNAIENSSFGLENAVERIQGKQKLEQFREELNLQFSNVGEETRIRIQERLEAGHHKPEGVS